MDKFTITTERQIEALNVPSNWDEINLSPITKFASKEKSFEDHVKAIDLGGFDILAAIKDNPDHLFVKVFAIKKDEVNDNGDYFSENELKKAAKTFIGVPVFVNHQNDDVEKARGKVVHAWWDEDRGGIYTINMVDKVAYPRLARGIEAGYVTGSSMGCSVKYSCCSVCHTRAANAKEYCSHIKERKKKNFTGEHECEYHKSANAGDEPCPVCGCEKGKKKLNKYASQQIFEHNYGVKFIEDSFVVNPACHDCLVSDIINPTGLLKKVADLRETLAKIGTSMDSDSSFGMECSSGQCSLHKAAGKQEINELNDAMNQLERVARSMMAQKSKVSLEYVSDIVKVCSDIQKISDELVEMGYAVLPSPTESQIAYGTNAPASPMTKPQSAVQMPVSAMPQPSSAAVPSVQPSMAMPAQTAAPMLKSVPMAANPQIQEFGDEVGRVTKPNFIPVKADSAKDFIKISNSITNRLNSLANRIYINGEFMSENSGYKFTQGDDTIVISSDNDGETHIAHLKGDRLMKWSSIDSFDADTQNMINHDPKQAARKILNSYLNNTSEESITSMESSNQNKVAQARTGDAHEVTTEAQLSGVKGIHARKGEAPTATTESKEQLGAAKSYSDVGGTSATPRQGTAYETVVEATLNSKTGGFMARWGSFPEVITEAQWNDISREVFANIPSDWTSVAKQGQLEMLQKTFSWTEPTVTTEGQLAGKSMKKASAQDLIKQAQGAIADAMAFYGVGAEDIQNTVDFITSDSSRQNKAKIVVAMNAAPWAVESRKVNNSRLANFSKVASEVYGVEPVDAVLAAVGDNLESSSAEEVLSALAFVANNKLAMQQAEELAVERYENATSESSEDDSDMFRKAFSEMSLPEDGIIKVCMSAEDDLGMEVSSGKDFIEAVHKFAQTMVNENLGQNVDIIPVAVDVDEDNGLVEATCKIASKVTDQEKAAFEKWASSVPAEKVVAEESSQTKRASLLADLDKLEKQAQLAGGQMPAGLNPAGMGMGMQLPGGAPPAGAPGVEALTAGAPVDPAAAAPMGADPLAGGDMGGEAEESKPKPPGAVCVVCGGQDVDVLGGKSKCNGPGCGLNYTIKIVPDASLLDKITDGDVDQEDVTASPESPEKGLGGEGAMSPAPDMGMGAPAPGGMPGMGGMAVAASTKISADTMKKFASKGELGSISPISGERNTVKLDKEHWQCLDSGQIYKVRLAAKTDDPKHVYAQWEWAPVAKQASCTPCERKKNAIIKALSAVGISEDSFDGMSMQDKAAALNTINDKGLLGTIKEASSDDVKGFFKQAFTVHGEFPMSRCIEKLANRYGENALALSGPCEGKNLAECVCGSLSDENVYTTKLANKIASAWSERDAMHECVEDFVRSGLVLNKAAQACEDLKSKYVSAEEIYAETLSEDQSIKSAMGDGEMDEEDPFDSEDFSDSPEGDEGEMPEMSGMDSGEDMEEDLDMDEPTEEEMPEGYRDESDDEGFDLDIEFENTDSSDMGEDADLDVEIEMPESEEGMEPESEESEMSEMPEQEEGEMDTAEDTEGPSMMEESDMMKEAPKSASQNDEIERLEKEAHSLRRGRIVGVNKLNIDIDSIRAALNKQAKSGKLEQTSAQDVVGAVANGKPHKDSTQEGFSAESPDVPSNGGKPLAAEHGEGFKESAPEIPYGDGQFEGEPNKGEMQNAITGGQAGQGKDHTGKYRKASNMFDQALSKLAKDMGLSVHTVQDDADLGQIANGKPHKDSTQEGFSAETPDVPENGGKPLSSEKGEGFKVDSPSIPAGDGQLGHESELGLEGEKQNQITGGQNGQGGAQNYKSKKASSANKEVAIKLAAKMVENGIIKADQMPAKLAELQRYEVSQLRDLEKAMFNRPSATKGLKVASSGVEQPLVINEVSSHKNASSDLKGKIASLFRLQQQVEMADESEAAKLRNAFK
jgi:hypothetical protein